MSNTKALILVFSTALALGIATTGAAAAKPLLHPPLPPRRRKRKSASCCLRRSSARGPIGADVAEPVRATLTAYLGGPATELIPLSARIPIQIDAEAQVIGCDYVLYSSVTQKKGGGFGKMLAAAAPIASMAGGMAGMGGNYATMMGAQVVASAATSAAAQVRAAGSDGSPGWSGEDPTSRRATRSRWNTN